MWNIRKSAEDHKGREGKLGRNQRETNHERLLTLGHKLGVVEGRWMGGWGNWVMGTKEGT